MTAKQETEALAKYLRQTYDLTSFESFKIAVEIRRNQVLSYRNNILMEANEVSRKRNEILKAAHVIHPNTPSALEKISMVLDDGVNKIISTIESS